MSEQEFYPSQIRRYSGVYGDSRLTMRLVRFQAGRTARGWIVHYLPPDRPGKGKQDRWYPEQSLREFYPPIADQEGKA